VPIYEVQPDRVANAVLRQLRRRFYSAVIVLAVCLVIITAGFFIIDVVGQQHRQDYQRALFDALWNTLNVVSTVGSLADVSPAERAGADRVIVPSQLAALQLSHLMLKPIVCEFVAAATGEGEFDFAEIPVADHPALAGNTLAQLDLPGNYEAIVISIVAESGDHEFSPRPDRKLTTGDTLLLVCREGGIDRLARIGQD
jgi:Trk K+ transport system NAD-binding subunit